MTFGAFLAQAWTMRNKPFALVAALAAAFALPLSPARAQYIVADIPADEETAVFDPDLRDVGVRLEKRYKQQIESVESSFALVILEEFEIIPGDRQVMEAVPVEPQSTTRLVAYVCLLPEEDDYLSAKGLYYCEIYSGKDSRPFLDEGAFPVSANRENDSFVWEAYLYDSEIQYHWANSKSSISNYSHLGDDLGQGLPGAPYKTESSKKTIFQSFIFYPYRIPCFMSFLRIYEKFLDFAKKGKSDANHSIEYQRDADDIEKVQLIYDKVHGESAPYGGMTATSFLWEAATKSGLLTKYDQTNMHNDGGSASMAHRWKIEQLEKHDESAIFFPTAWESLRRLPMPALPVPDPFTLPDGTVVTGGKIEQGAYWQQKRAILLYSEFDDPAHLEHMALEPDSLAAWLGVSLQWTNPEGCRVESHPPDAEKNMGIPRPKLLMEIRKKIDEGEIKVEWPFDNEGGASGGDGAAAGE